jgi:hypothetical protein
VAVAESQGPDAGLFLLNGMAPPSWLEASYLWEAVLSDSKAAFVTQPLCRRKAI